MFMIFRVLILYKFILGFLNSLIASSDPDPKHYSSKEKVRDIAISHIAKSFFLFTLRIMRIQFNFEEILIESNI